MQRKIEQFRRRVHDLPRVCKAAFALFCTAALLLVAVLNFRVVTVEDSSGRRSTLLTLSTEPREIVQLAGLSTSRYDKVQYTASFTGGTVYIERAVQVTLHADDIVRTTHLAGTVADLLAASGIALGPDDLVEPAADTELCEDMLVRVYRVQYVEEVRRQELNAEEVAAFYAQHAPGEDYTESYNGSYDVTWLDRMVNGVVVESEMLQLAPLIAPRPADSYTITEGVPCSRIVGYDDIAMGPDGIPANYTSVMEGAVCTAYSSSGGKGASGLGLYCGTVAVNPNVIPYGTRMYITSADGSFIYGFAIATDTGTAMMEGYVDIDLYFETNAECLQFGKRPLNVYILD